MHKIFKILFSRLEHHNIFFLFNVNFSNSEDFVLCRSIVIISNCKLTYGHLFHCIFRYFLNNTIFFWRFFKIANKFCITVIIFGYPENCMNKKYYNYKLTELFHCLKPVKIYQYVQQSRSPRLYWFSIKMKCPMFFARIRRSLFGFLFTLNRITELPLSNTKASDKLSSEKCRGICKETEL